MNISRRTSSACERLRMRDHPLFLRSFSPADSRCCKKLTDGAGRVVAGYLLRACGVCANPQTQKEYAERMGTPKPARRGLGCARPGGDARKWGVGAETEKTRRRGASAETEAVLAHVLAHRQAEGERRLVARDRPVPARDVDVDVERAWRRRCRHTNSCDEQGAGVCVPASAEERESTRR